MSPEIMEQQFIPPFDKSAANPGKRQAQAVDSQRSKNNTRQ